MKTVKPLRAADRAEIRRHLHALPQEDRRQLFGEPLAAADIERYVQAIDFERDRLFGVFETELVLEGLVHLAPEEGGAAARLGLSVIPMSRGAGYGYALLVCAAQHAAALGCRRLYMHGLMENRVVLHLARKAGLMLALPQGDSAAHLALGEGDARDPAPRRVAPLRWAAQHRALALFVPLLAVSFSLLAAAGTTCRSCDARQAVAAHCAPERVAQR